MSNEVKEIPSDYTPITYSIPLKNKDIFSYDEKPEFSREILYPQMKNGFQHFIHQSKTKMSIVQEFEGKKKVYYVLNQFERYVDDYDADINNISKAYFDIDPKPNILSRAFYKLWELFFMFDLIDLNENNFISAHLAEGPGSFIQATMFYRDKFTKKGMSKNDKYYAITLHAENIDKHIPKLEESFIDYYKKEKPSRFNMHRTYPREEARLDKNKDDGDLTNPKTIELFGGNFTKQKTNLITADGGFDWENEIVQEQEAYKLILAQIISALKIQAKHGNFVCKVYESFTDITLKFIQILTEFYENVYGVKPLMSRSSNSEKYLVCLNFNDPKDKDKKIKKLESILEQMNKYKDYNLVNIFPDFIFDGYYKSTMIKLDTQIANKQFIAINEIVDFIKKQNYRGDEYQKRRDMQIEATKYWLDKFFPSPKEFIEKRNFIKKLTDDTIKKNELLSIDLQKKLE